MEIFWGLENFKQLENAVVTMGTFDGVHLGHQEIIKDLVQTSKTNQAKSVLITFDPHPRKVLQPDIPLQLIQSVEEKNLVLQTTGIDYLIIIPFDKQFSELSSLEFIQKILVEKIGCKKLVIGYDHHFGKNREGSFEYLKNNSHLFGFEVKEISAKKIDETKISSTAIRKYIKDGEIKKANLLLNYTYFIIGKIVDGEKIGRKIGFPTANIQVDTNKLIHKKSFHHCHPFPFSIDHFCGNVGFYFIYQSIQYGLFDKVFSGYYANFACGFRAFEIAYHLHLFHAKIAHGQFGE